ncbi:3,4-dihydroxy-2-butanone 4-phosphate synthase [Lysobacter antibioticus]|uniref:3,4-dihydroxy-2-butanone 4-phosphate synthase n=1 Tax=Lysobacter antibioticus TaxID=84531 RepID=A0A0S2F714_LYSAN|nr:3,4-dihydroxy-2-butanone-4-phosphate synthase [Lysobacter antibioticus]ALN65119.1 3,4-dihydroxy-2-butanone 4-phosphate synthase [Lysobacter antibioticus]ALN79312.1 3,4-dihydroxy-2-butanone-4-phosphate synthase [Lysobacter antibioticus]
MNFATVPELLEEIRAGRMVVIVDDEDRENEGDLIMAAELVRPADINFMVTHARGLVCLSLMRERCLQLGLGPMVRDNTSSHHTNFTVSIEAAEGVTTGISAYDRAHTVRTAVRPDAKPSDLAQPGHIFPLMSQPGGVLSRAGHTEAASDLALLAGLEPAGVLVEVLNADGSMARRPQLEAFAAEHGLKIGSIEELIRYRLATEHTVERVDARTIETEHGPFRLLSYRDRLTHALHFALQRGEPDANLPTLVRVHIQNPLADALHWRRPDFGPAVGDVLAAIAREGSGALVVLADHADPETLLARVREAAPEAAHDGAGGDEAAHTTVPVPTRGHALAEWRRNGAGGQILADLGLGKLRVLGTPRRQIGLAGFGLEVVEYVDIAKLG